MKTTKKVTGLLLDNVKKAALGVRKTIQKKSNAKVQVRKTKK